MYRDPTEFRNRFKAYKNGKMPYKAGRVDENYEKYFSTLPNNQKNSTDYRQYRYWLLNDKPKTFGEAVGRGMFSLEFDGPKGLYGMATPTWHGGSVSYNRSTGNYEFMKPNTHPTRWMEDIYGYWSPDNSDFRENYKLEKSAVYDKYVPKKNVYNLPGFEDGLTPTIDGGTPFEITVTGKDRRPAWKKMYQNKNLGDTSQYYNSNVIRNITDWVPGIGDVSQGYDALHAAQKGNYGEAAFLGGLMLLPNVLEKPLKFAARKLPVLQKFTKSTLLKNVDQLPPPPQEINIDIPDIDIPDIEIPPVQRWSDELRLAMDDVGYRHHYIIDPFASEELVWRNVRELQHGTQLIQLRRKTPGELSPRDLAIQNAITDAGPESTYNLSYFNMSPRQAYQTAMQDWQNIPVGSSFALINDGALSTDSAPMVYNMMSRFGDEAELVPVITNTGELVMLTLNSLGRVGGKLAIDRINSKIDLLNNTRGMNLPYSAIDPTSGAIMIPSVYARRIVPPR